MPQMWKHSPEDVLFLDTWRPAVVDHVPTDETLDAVAKDDDVGIAAPSGGGKGVAQDEVMNRASQLGLGPDSDHPANRSRGLSTRPLRIVKGKVEGIIGANGEFLPGQYASVDVRTEAGRELVASTFSGRTALQARAGDDFYWTTARSFARPPYRNMWEGTTRALIGARDERVRGRQVVAGLRRIAYFVPITNDAWQENWFGRDSVGGEMPEGFAGRALEAGESVDLCAEDKDIICLLQPYADIPPVEEEPGFASMDEIPAAYTALAAVLRDRYPDRLNKLARRRLEAFRLEVHQFIDENVPSAMIAAFRARSD